LVEVRLIAAKSSAASRSELATYFANTEIGLLLSVVSFMRARATLPLGVFTQQDIDRCRRFSGAASWRP
jgi:hypothetical protein